MQNFNEFIDYCLSFYGVGGIYPENKRTKEVQEMVQRVDSNYTVTPSLGIILGDSVVLVQMYSSSKVYL